MKTIASTREFSFYYIIYMTYQNACNYLLKLHDLLGKHSNTVSTYSIL